MDFRKMDLENAAARASRRAREATDHAVMAGSAEAHMEAARACSQAACACAAAGDRAASDRFARACGEHAQLARRRVA